MRPGPPTCSTGGGGLCGSSFIFSPRLRRPFFCLHVFRHSGQQGGWQPGTRCVLKHRAQKSWPQSSETGSRSFSRQMEQVGSSRGAAGLDPRLSSNLGNGVWDLGGRMGHLRAACRVQGAQAKGLRAQAEPKEAMLCLFLTDLHPRTRRGILGERKHGTGGIFPLLCRQLQPRASTSPRPAPRSLIVQEGR